MRSLQWYKRGAAYDSIHEQHEKLMNFINDVFVWRDRKDMGAYLGEIPSVEISEEE